MSGSKTSEGDGLLSALDARMRQIAEETFRRLSLANDAGAVKVKDAAPMLGMCEGRVRALIHEGKLRVVRPTPHTIKIPLSEIRRYLEEHKK